MTFYRSNFTCYLPDVNTIYIDSLINGFHSIEDIKEATTKSASEYLNTLQSFNTEENVRFELSFGESDHFCILKKITSDKDGNDNKSIALVVYDIFAVEEISEGSYKYREDFIINSINDDEEYNKSFGKGYYQIILNGNNVSYKSSIGEALLFVDYFIHSHVICAAINGDLIME